MITESMNTNEVLRELNKINEYVCDKWDGLSIKNKKLIKNKFVKSGSVMSVSNHIVPKTRDSVVVYAMKYVGTLSGKNYSTMYLMHYVKTYFGTYIVSITNRVNNKVDGYVIFTRHAVERIRERLGKDFGTFFKEDFILKSRGALSPIEDNYKDRTEYVARFGDAFVFIEKEDGGRKIVVKTALSEKELYSNQKQEKDESQKGGDAAWESLIDYVWENYKKDIKSCKSEGILKQTA